MKTDIFKPSFWKVVAVVIISAGLYTTYLRFTQGLAATTNLSDEFPWGMWIGFDILCGVCLAAGGFLICALTHIFNIEQFKSLARPAILTAFLGYVMVICGLMYDLGRPISIWHAIIMWNPHSVMFEVAWCVMLYTTVLFLEFSPMILERFKLTKLQSILKKVSIVIMILGVLLSTLHQSSLGSLFLIVPTKMHPLWYSPLLPVYFYLTAISAGFAMVIFESYLSARSFGRGIELTLLSKIGLYCAWFLTGVLAIRFGDLLLTGKALYLVTPGQEMYLFWLEILIGSLIPLGIFLQRKKRQNRKWLYLSAVAVVCGAMLNRMNVSITSLNGFAKTNYFPSINEISVTLMLVAIGMIAFGLAVKYLPVFPPVEHEGLDTELSVATDK
jgi:Ni/Fe-hydrogenase subunit HybB-like protein